MAWVRIDDHTYDHPKILKVGPDAAWLWFTSICYSSRYLTDGFLADEVVKRIATGPGSRVQRLVGAGLWDVVEGGYQIHDYHDYQPTKHQVREKRAATAERQSRWRRGVTNAPTNAVTNAPTNAVTNADPTPTPTPTPTPKKKRTPPTPLRGELVRATMASFDRFWSSYPKKVGKGAARASWAKLMPDEALVTKILAGVVYQRRSAQWLRDGGRYIPNPATWLNQQRWDDQPDPDVPVVSDRTLATMRAGKAFLGADDDNQ